MVLKANVKYVKNSIDRSTLAAAHFYRVYARILYVVVISHTSAGCNEGARAQSGAWEKWGPAAAGYILRTFVYIYNCGGKGWRYGRYTSSMYYTRVPAAAAVAAVGAIWRRRRRRRRRWDTNPRQFH